MHQPALKLLIAPVMALAFILGFATPSMAANTWKPVYSTGHHVYLDPALKNSDNPVNLDGLEASYQAESAKNDLELFFIMTLKGDEATPGNIFAETRLREIMGNWGGQSGFPADRAVVCYVVRLNTNWTKSAVACNVASELAAKNLNTAAVFAIADRYSQHRTANPDALLPQNPKGFALKVAQGANQIVVDFAAQQLAKKQAVEAERQAALEQAAAAERQAAADRAAEAAHAAAMHKVAVSIEITAPILIVLIVLLVLYMRKRGAFARAAKAIADWDGLFQTANSQYIKLDGQYLDFLKRQGANWKDKFKGTTLVRYTAAISAYADLSARIQIANKLLEAAKAANDSGNIFSLAGNLLALATLTTIDVTIDSKSLSFEEQGLFGATLDGKAKTEKPDELLKDMDALFRTTNKTMADIMEAFEGSETNRKEIEGLFLEVQALKTSLTEASLSFAAYQGGYDRLVQDKDAFLAIVGSDPLQAYEQSKTVDQACKDLKTKIGNAIGLRKSLSTTENNIATATARIAEVRGQAADYKYPDGGKPADGAATKYLFNEAGSNPDDSLTEAKDQLSKAIALVMAGRLDESKTAKDNAEAKAAEVEVVINKVLAAKATVQKDVPTVHSALEKLTAEIPGGAEALAALNAGFLPKDFNTAPAQLAQAKKVETSTTSQLAAIKAAFFEQRFVAASKLVATVTGDIQGSRNGIIAILTRLTELTGLRQHSKEQTARNAQTMSGLQSKITANAFTTSARTDGSFAALAPTLGQNQVDVEKAITDWPAAATSADQLASNLQAIDGAIDSEKSAYNHAASILDALRLAVSAAVSEGNSDSNIVRQAAKEQIHQAQQVLARSEAAIKVAKSDWNVLSRRFEGEKRTATDAKDAAIADKNAYNEAATAIRNAQTNIDAVEGGNYVTYSSIGGSYSRNYGAGISADCSQARSYLRTARSLLTDQRYEDAERQAETANTAAANAKAAAEARVQELIAAAVLLWQAEEAARMERERIERERLQAIEDARIERERAEAARLQAIEDDRIAQARRQQEALDSAAQAQRDAASQQQQNSDNTQGGNITGGDNTQGGDFS